MSTEYPKVYGPFKRFTEGPNRNKLDLSRFAKEEFELLWSHNWVWTEKLDGTNIRVIWDGHRVSFGGRTDKAVIPVPLMKHLAETFTEELMEQTFGSDQVTLYGEGVGAGIQKGGGNYGQEQHFVLFDVRVGKWWLKPHDMLNVADSLGVPSTKLVRICTPEDAIELVKVGFRSAHQVDNPFYAEGLVGTPVGGFLSRSGERIIMKLKTVDFKE